MTAEPLREPEMGEVVLALQQWQRHLRDVGQSERAGNIDTVVAKVMATDKKLSTYHTALERISTWRQRWPHQASQAANALGMERIARAVLEDDGTEHIDTPTQHPVRPDPLEAHPGMARAIDAYTSHQAARNPANQVTWANQRGRLLRTYMDGVARTDEQAGLEAGVERVADTRRCSELRRAGYLKPTGATHPTSHGHEAMTCTITEEGRAAALAAWQKEQSHAG